MRVYPLIAAAAFSFIFASTAHTQTAEEFYKGRQIQMVVGYEVGNDYDIGARLLARYLSKELPGNPTVVVQNMPQASGVVAANYMALKAARDGTVIGGISRNLPSQAMMKLPNIEADPRKFIWLGATSFPGRVCVASSAAPVKKAEDLFTTDLLTGAAGTGSSTDIVPTVISKVLGMRFKMVQGYRGAGDILLAVDRGEVHAVCMSLGQFRTSEQKFKDGKLR
jgi:tripartite-type tricarboxylate transporter receptor subunit TctC